MSESLYPHEAISEFMKNNIFRFDAAGCFVWAGIWFGVFCEYKTPMDLVISAVFCIAGWAFQHLDYKRRSLN